MKNELEQLLQKEMDRKAFLKHVGLGFAVMTGAATIMKTLNTLGAPAKKTFGYSSSSYGGQKLSAKTQKS